MKTIRFTHPELKLIIKADLDDGAAITTIKLSLPRKATKLEKLLLKFVEIYCYDQLRNNLHNAVLESKEYQKAAAKMNIKLSPQGV